MHRNPDNHHCACKIIYHSPWWILLVAYFVTLIIFAGLLLGIYKLMGYFKSEPSFEIEGLLREMEALTPYICQIRVHNCSMEKTAQNVKVEILQMETSRERNKPYFEAKPPITLFPENETGNFSINPGAEKNFTLFDARKVEGQSRSNVDLPLVAYCYVWSEFKNPEHKTIDHKKFAFFEKNSAYPIKIRVTAHDLPPTETEFNLKFIGDGSQCRFTLTKTQSKKPPKIDTRLIIISASWGIEDKYADVTGIVRSYLIENKIEMPCEISILGEPRPNLGKILTIHYSIGDKKSQKSFKEHDIISPQDLK